MDHQTYHQNLMNQLGQVGGSAVDTWESLRRNHLDRAVTDQAIKVLQAAMAKAAQEAEAARRNMPTRDMVSAALAELKQMREKMDELTAMLATVALTADETSPATTEVAKSATIAAASASTQQKLAKLLGRP